MDDQPTDLSREAEPGQSETVEGGADPSSATAEPEAASGEPEAGSGEPEAGSGEPDAASGAPVIETRAQRRARQEAVLKEPVLPALATVRRPIAVIATIVLAALLVLALLADPVLLAAGLAWAGIVVAWGWPSLPGVVIRGAAAFVEEVVAPGARALVY